MSNYRMNMILEGLSDISESKQKLWYIEYTSKGTTDAKVICNSQSYNKYKKFAQGYKEIEKIEITNDSEKRFYTSKIRSELEGKYGIENYVGNNRFDTYTKDGYACTIVGKYKTDSYGYMVSDTKLEESYVSEAGKQKLMYVEFTGKHFTDGKMIIPVKGSRGYTDYIQDYKVIKRVDIADDSEKSLYTEKIRDELQNKYGIKAFRGDGSGWMVETKDGYIGEIDGKYKTNFYCYKISNQKASKSVDESVKMVEADVDAQYEIFRKTGKYPEETIVKAEWELDKADDNHIFLTKNGKKRKFKVIPDNRGMRGFIGKPMKTGVKAVNGVDGFIKTIEKDIKDSPGGKSTIATNIFNGIWDTTKDAK